jgi:hypothetical protein
MAHGAANRKAVDLWGGNTMKPVGKSFVGSRKGVDALDILLLLAMIASSFPLMFVR